MHDNNNFSHRLKIFWLHNRGWFTVALLSFAPAVMWAIQNDNFSNLDSFYSWMSAIGEVAGLVGMIMYALNFILATRLRFLENLFGGLNRVYIAHHILGGLSLVLLLLHPVFLMLRSITDSVRTSALLIVPHDLSPVSALFNPQAEEHYQVLQQWAIFAGTIALLGLIGLIIVSMYIKLPYRVWLLSHKFMGLAFFIAGLHVLFISSDTSENGLLKFYILGLTALALISFVYRSLLGNILVRKYYYHVEYVAVEGGNVAHILLKPVKNPIHFKSGQFVFIRFKYSGVQGISKEWHPFSISSGANTNFLRLSVKALGDYTASLVNIKPGAIAEIEGAFGKFSYSNFKNKNQIWIAGGIGITPFLSMAQDLLKEPNYRIDLYYSVKSTSELIDFQNLTEIARLSQNRFRIIPNVSETSGMLTVDKIEYWSGGLAGKEIFICGPPPMMKALKAQLDAKNFPMSNVHSEEFAMS